MTTKANVIQVGATRKGKTLSAARCIVESTDEAAVILDPHKQSLAQTVLAHATGELLYDKLSDLRHSLGFDMLAPSSNPDPLQRELENQLRAEAFAAILLRRRDADGMAGTPLLEEWCHAALALYLNQDQQIDSLSPKILPFAFMPGTDEFARLVKGCRLPEIRHKFRQLEGLTPRGLRAEVGSAVRLFNAVFRSPAFAVRCRGGFDLGVFLQRRGKLVIERGDEIGDDAMRAIMGAVILMVIEFAKRRPVPYPPIRIYIDEATNARLVGAPELRGLAETNKNGLYWTFLVQNMDFPSGSSDAVFQNCHRHEFFGSPNYQLARLAATDVLAGLLPSDRSRAERIEELTHDIMMLPPGWRWVRDARGSWKEYVPLLRSPYPNWPGLAEAKFKEKLCRIRARPEYGVSNTPNDTTSSNDTPLPPSKSRNDSSLAERWKRRKRKHGDGSSSKENEDESE